MLRRFIPFYVTRGVVSLIYTDELRELGLRVILTSFTACTKSHVYHRNETVLDQPPMLPMLTALILIVFTSFAKRVVVDS